MTGEKKEKKEKIFLNYFFVQQGESLDIFPLFLPLIGLVLFQQEIARPWVSFCPLNNPHLTLYHCFLKHDLCLWLDLPTPIWSVKTKCSLMISQRILNNPSMPTRSYSQYAALILYQKWLPFSSLLKYFPLMLLRPGPTSFIKPSLTHLYNLRGSLIHEHSCINRELVYNFLN